LWGTAIDGAFGRSCIEEKDKFGITQKTSREGGEWRESTGEGEIWKGSESADYSTVTVLLVMIAIMMSHVDSPRVLIVQDIPTHSEEQVERDVSLRPLGTYVIMTPLLRTVCSQICSILLRCQHCPVAPSIHT
jgi:hypothetical protein